jgi:multicomponent Na+:H+ antiporter subunit E
VSRLFAVLLLAAVYALTLSSLDSLDLAAGVVLGAAVLLIFRRLLFSDEGAPLGAVELAGRLVRFPMFALVVIWEITIGTWRVTQAVTGLRPLRKPGIVAVPIGERTRSGLATTALAITLSPGELLVDIDEQRQLMLIHVLDADDPDAIRARYEHFYERWQKGVFP